MENVLRGEYSFKHDAFKNVSEGSLDLIMGLLQVDINKRFSAKEAFNHPWIQNIQDEYNVEITSQAFSDMKHFI
jgi:calcium-dependent protein kinase